MFGQGKQRITKSEVFEKFPRLSLGARILFDALPKYAADNGITDLDMDEFSNIIVFGDSEELYEWLRELIKSKLILPYDDQEKFGYIKGWHLSGSATYTTTPKDMKSKWRNPDPPAHIQAVIDQEVEETEHRKGKRGNQKVVSGDDSVRTPQRRTSTGSSVGGSNKRTVHPVDGELHRHERELTHPIGGVGTRPVRSSTSRAKEAEGTQEAPKKKLKQLKKFNKSEPVAQPEKPKSYSVKELDMLGLEDVRELRRRGKITDALFQSYMSHVEKRRVSQAQKAVEALAYSNPRTSAQVTTKVPQRLNQTPKKTARTQTGATYLRERADKRKLLEVVRPEPKKILRKRPVKSFDPVDFADLDQSQLVRLFQDGTLTKEQLQEVKMYQRTR